MKKFIGLLHNFFVPHEKNQYRAKALHIDSLTVYVIFFLFLTIFFKHLNNQPGSVLGYATDITIDKLYQLTNQQRIANGLGTLTYNQKLAQAAAGKAANMFQKNYWAHFGPDGESPWNFILGAGYQYEYAGENLAKNFSFSDDVVNAWMNSPSHRENMLRREYTDVGFAIMNGVLNGEETTLVVQMFGKPLATSVDTVKPEAAAPKPVVTAVPTVAVIPTTAPVVTIAQKPLVPAEPVQAEVLSKQVNKEKQPTINLFPYAYRMNLTFLFMLAIVIVFDFFMAARLKVIHVGGKHLGHFLFINFILIGLLIATTGSIL